MAKKAANKKSPKPGPAAKKAAAGGEKKATKKKAAAGGEKKATKKKKASSRSSITRDDLAQVYAKAWADEAFRTLLETDPTAALKQYAAENGLEWTKIALVPPPPGEDENCIHLVSCC